MATLDKPDFKRSYPNWFTQIHAQSRAATDARKASSNLREKARSMRISTDSKTKADQYDTNARLSDRIWTTRQWHEELAAQLSRLKDRMADLRDAKQLSEDYLVKITDAQQVNTESLTHLDHRRQNEFVLDPVEEELRNEQVLLKELYNDLQGQILEAFETLLLIQEASSTFYIDIADKKNAMEIDIDQYNLSERSAGVSFKPFATRLAENGLDIQGWEDLSRCTMERARAVVECSAEVIHRLHLGLHQVANRMGAKADRVSDTLRLRAHDAERAIRELEFQRSMTEEERERLRNELRNLEEARKAKYASLKLAQTRLEGRHDRRANEELEDAPQQGLKDELLGIVDSIDALDEQIDKSKQMLNRLDDQLARLCQELLMKREMLQVLQEVINIRKRLEVPTHTRTPYCPMIPTGIIREATVF